MSHYVTENWIPESGSGVPRRDKAGGPFRAYVPDHLAHKAWSFSPELTSRAARIEREILRLNRHAASGQVESVARLLMRSEAISSARIEGIAPNVDKVVLAELAQEEEVRGFKESAEEVARNLTVLRSIEKSFATEPTISVELLERLQRELMGENGSIPTGLRTIQNWIGGSNHTPIGAEFIPAPPRLVHDLVDDLCLYLDGASHGALIQAAIAHAQFETIHPFADGNGRVGRALIHGILLRRGLTEYTILPVSLVLGTWSTRYVQGLTAYRQGDVDEWLSVFLDAAEEAVKQARLIADDLARIQEEWFAAVEETRREEGMQRALRADSLEAKLLTSLPAHPIVTVTSIQRLYGITPGNARKALDRLSGAGILRTKVIAKNGGLGYYADDILSLLDLADRQLASSRFDTRLSPPTGRAVPRAQS